MAIGRITVARRDSPAVDDVFRTSKENLRSSDEAYKDDDAYYPGKDSEGTTTDSAMDAGAKADEGPSAEFGTGCIMWHVEKIGETHYSFRWYGFSAAEDTTEPN